MSDETSEAKDKPKRPMTDRSTVASKFQKKTGDAAASDEPKPAAPPNWQPPMMPEGEGESHLGGLSLGNKQRKGEPGPLPPPGMPDSEGASHLGGLSLGNRQRKGEPGPLPPPGMPEGANPSPPRPRPAPNKPDPQKESTQEIASAEARRALGIAPKAVPVRPDKDPERRLQNLSNPKTEGRVLEGDTWWERIKPTLLSTTFGLLIIGMVGYYLWRGGLFEAKPALAEDSESSRVTASPAFSGRAESALNRAAALAEENVTAMGGYERMQTLSSTRWRGNVTTPDGRVTPFSLYARRPDYYRAVYDLGNDVQQVVGFDGRTAWQETKVAGVSHGASALSQEARSMFLLGSDYDLPPQKYILREGYGSDREMPQMEVQYARRDIIDGEVHEIVRVTEAGRPTAICYYDASDRRITRIDWQLDGRDYQTQFKRYREIDGMIYPTLREHYVDGELVATVDLESVAFNAGAAILSMFAPPKTME